MKLSIITVVYNDGNGLKKTLDSLAKQVNKNFEHIVIDGNSSHENLEVIYQNIDKIDFFITEPDEGIYDAMNKGIKNTSGEFISFLNAGDEALPNYTKICIDFFTENQDLDYCYSSIIMTSNNRTTLYHPRDKYKDFLQRMPFPHPGLFVKKSLFKKVGCFNLKKQITADHEWVVRMLLSNAKGAKSDAINPVVNFKLDGVSLSFKTAIEMKETAIFFGRSWIIANLKMLRSFLVVAYYKFFK